MVRWDMLIHVSPGEGHVQVVGDDIYYCCGLKTRKEMIIGVIGGKDAKTIEW